MSQLGQHQEAFSRDLHLLMAEAYRLGYECRRGEVLRTPEQQLIYAQTGRSKTLNSMHLKKCAADLHFFKDGALYYPAELGRFWESLSPLNRWGGNFDKNWTHEDNFKDQPHFERNC